MSSAFIAPLAASTMNSLEHIIIFILKTINIIFFENHFALLIELAEVVECVIGKRFYWLSPDFHVVEDGGVAGRNKHL